MYSFKQQPPILYFHSVAPKKNPDWVRSYLTLELKYFKDLLKFIQRKRYNTFFISELDDDQLSHKNSIALSFDDGYLDNYVYVYPLLKKYKIKATIFCSIDYIDPESKVRSTLENVWNNELKEDELDSWGFCSVEELKIMESSGYVDIQSHTLTHDKYPVSDKIIGFHYPGNTKVNFYFHENPEIKPYYITDQRLTEKITTGTPLFEEKSAIISPRVWINDVFKNEVIKKLTDFDWNTYNFQIAYNKISEIVTDFQSKNKTITKKENEDEYLQRVKHEIYYSKEKLEKILNKRIEVICWPHGDFNQTATQLAVEAGYKKIHYVENKSRGVVPADYHFIRTGMSEVRNNRFLTILKTKSRIYQAMNTFPFVQIGSLYRKFKKL